MKLEAHPTVRHLSLQSQGVENKQEPATVGSQALNGMGNPFREQPQVALAGVAFDLEIADPNNVVLVQIIYPGQLQLLDLARKSGCLRVHSAVRGSEGHVYFKSGAVVRATTRDNPHSLGVLLRKAGKLNEAQLREATAAQARGECRVD